MKNRLNKTKNKEKEKQENPTHNIRVSPETWVAINNLKGEGKSWERFFKELIQGHDTN